MQAASKLTIGALVFLAVAAGLSKLMLMQQEVNFFGTYGFDESLIIVFGIVQVAGGALLIFRDTRRVGAAFIAVTFLFSIVLHAVGADWVSAGLTGSLIALLAYASSQRGAMW